MSLRIEIESNKPGWRIHYLSFLPFKFVIIIVIVQRCHLDDHIDKGSFHKEFLDYVNITYIATHFKRKHNFVKRHLPCKKILRLPKVKKLHLFQFNSIVQIEDCFIIRCEKETNENFFQHMLYVCNTFMFSQITQKFAMLRYPIYSSILYFNLGRDYQLRMGHINFIICNYQ